MRKLLVLIFFIITQSGFGQDSLQAITFKYDWVVGIHIGTYYNALSGDINKTFENTTLGFKIGFEVEYTRVFLNIDAGWSNGKTKNNIQNDNNFIEKLPLDSKEIFVSLGHRFLIHRIFSIKPMLTAQHVNYATDDRVKEFTGINREYEFTYYGIDLAIIKHSDTFNYGGLELSIGVGFPSEFKGIDNIKGTSWKFTFGYRGFNVH